MTEEEEEVPPMKETVPAETAPATSPEQTASEAEKVAATLVSAASGEPVEEAEEQVQKQYGKHVKLN